MDKETVKSISERLINTPANCATFLGSGDFHHVSHILINQIERPFSVIIFDHHPDWDSLPPRLGCGSWVNQILKNKNLQKCILMGVSSSDISTWSIQAGNLGSLEMDRVEIYPYSHRTSLVFCKKIPRNISLASQGGVLYNKIRWNELKDKNLTEFFSSLLKRMPTKEVYVSIDKDCLRNDYALTNWEEGFLSLDELLLMLGLIRENLDIIGADIVGDYSQITVDGWLKSFLSRLDHPKHIEAEKYPQTLVTSRNESTNFKILEILNS